MCVCSFINNRVCASPSHTVLCKFSFNIEDDIEKLYYDVYQMTEWIKYQVQKRENEVLDSDSTVQFRPMIRRSEKSSVVHQTHVVINGLFQPNFIVLLV